MAGDPLFRHVVFLSHLDGADNGTVFTDVIGNAVTRNGQVVTKTGTKKFGTAAAYFDWSTDSLSIGPSDRLNLTGDFAIECEVYCSDLAAERGVYYQGDGTDANRLQVSIYPDGHISFFARTAVTDPNFDAVSSAGVISAATWHHVAATVSGTAVKLFVDGALVASATLTGSMPSGYAAHWGKTRTGTLDRWMLGYIDEARITNGHPRYTEAFTPPTEPFPNFDVARLAIPQQAAIVRMINPYTLDGRTQPRITTVPASFCSGLGTITGMIAEDTPFARWSLSVLDAVTGEKLSQTESTGSSYSIQAPKGRPVLVTCVPAIDGVWQASYRAAPGEIIVARSPGDTPYVYRCTVGGVTGATEPEWGTTPGGTTADGAAVWTCLARLVQPRMQGPLLAA